MDIEALTATVTAIKGEHQSNRAATNSRLSALDARVNKAATGGRLHALAASIDSIKNELSQSTRAATNTRLCALDAKVASADANHRKVLTAVAVLDDQVIKLGKAKGNEGGAGRTFGEADAAELVKQAEAKLLTVIKCSEEGLEAKLRTVKTTVDKQMRELYLLSEGITPKTLKKRMDDVDKRLLDINEKLENGAGANILRYDTLKCRLDSLATEIQEQSTDTRPDRDTPAGPGSAGPVSSPRSGSSDEVGADIVSRASKSAKQQLGDDSKLAQRCTAEAQNKMEEAVSTRLDAAEVSRVCFEADIAEECMRNARGYAALDKRLKVPESSLPRPGEKSTADSKEEFKAMMAEALRTAKVEIRQETQVEVAAMSQKMQGMEKELAFLRLQVKDAAVLRERDILDRAGTSGVVSPSHVASGQPLNLVGFVHDIVYCAIMQSSRVSMTLVARNWSTFEMLHRPHGVGQPAWWMAEKVDKRFTHEIMACLHAHQSMGGLECVDPVAQRYLTAPPPLLERIQPGMPDEFMREYQVAKADFGAEKVHLQEAVKAAIDTIRSQCQSAVTDIVQHRAIAGEILNKTKVHVIEQLSHAAEQKLGEMEDKADRLDMTMLAFEKLHAARSTVVISSVGSQLDSGKQPDEYTPSSDASSEYRLVCRSDSSGSLRAVGSVTSALSKINASAKEAQPYQPLPRTALDLRSHPNPNHSAADHSARANLQHGRTVQSNEKASEANGEVPETEHRSRCPEVRARLNTQA